VASGQRRRVATNEARPSDAPINSMTSASLQSSLRDGISLAILFPGLERPGYHQPSLRDESARTPSSIATICVRREKRGIGTLLLLEALTGYFKR
jgi:hypothetical protein